MVAQQGVSWVSNDVLGLGPACMQQENWCLPIILVVQGTCSPGWKGPILLTLTLAPLFVSGAGPKVESEAKDPKHPERYGYSWGQRRRYRHSMYLGSRGIWVSGTGPNRRGLRRKGSFCLRRAHRRSVSITSLIQDVETSTFDRDLGGEAKLCSRLTRGRSEAW